MTVVVLTNNYATVAGSITEAIAGMVFGKAITTPAVTLASNPHDSDPRIAGNYRVAVRGWTFTIEFRDGRPVAMWNEVRMSSMLRVSDDTWFEPLDWATLQLKFDDGGKFVGGTFTLPGSVPLKVERL